MTPSEEKAERFRAQFDNLSGESQELVAFSLLITELVKLEKRAELMALIDVIRVSFATEKLAGVIKVINNTHETFPEAPREFSTTICLKTALETLAARDTRQKKELEKRLITLNILEPDTPLTPKHEPEVQQKQQRKGEL